MPERQPTRNARPGPIASTVGGPLGRALSRTIGKLGEPIYRAELARRNRAFDRGVNVERLDTPVVSVGNLSVGGTGKTPTVMWVVRTLRDSGETPGVAMRGYKARPGELSDEQAEYACRLPDTPVEADARRIDAARRLLDRGATCVVLDDGFQHRRLARDLDIVLLDLTRPVFDDRCLPAGWLREPVSALHRAGAIVLTHAEAATPAELLACERRVRGLVGEDTPIAVAEHAWTGVDVGPNGDREAVNWLASKRAVLVSGIGNPDAFEAAARAHGVAIAHHVAQPDHHDHTPADAVRYERMLIDHDAQVLLTTAKDWVKLRAIVRPELAARCARPTLSMRFTRGEADLQEALRRTLGRARRTAADAGRLER